MGISFSRRENKAVGRSVGRTNEAFRQTAAAAAAQKCHIYVANRK